MFSLRGLSSVSLITVRVLVIDYRDSFTFNLVAYLEDLLGHRPEVVTYDSGITLNYAASFDAIVLSPGPGRVDKPQDIALCALPLPTCRPPLPRKVGGLASPLCV